MTVYHDRHVPPLVLRDGKQFIFQLNHFIPPYAIVKELVPVGTIYIIVYSTLLVQYFISIVI